MFALVVLALRECARATTPTPGWKHRLFEGCGLDEDNDDNDDDEGEEEGEDYGVGGGMLGGAAGGLHEAWADATRGRTAEPFEGTLFLKTIFS